MEKRPIIFGEVLFDEFPDGSSVIGGAPFNVAWHLQGFGLRPLMISAVGDDALGTRVLDTMSAWDMDTRCIQTLADAPTGRVSISLQQGQPSYDILDHQAYDAIGSLPGGNDRGENYGLLYHGSLALRHDHNRGTLRQWQERLDLPCFTDINLRPPWWQAGTVDLLLNQTRWVKLNDQELLSILNLPTATSAQWPVLARQLLDRYPLGTGSTGLERVILTLGEHGALYIDREQVLQGEPVPVQNLQDTVGAGDAFAAVTILGLLREWPMPDTLQRALAFASAICARQGATTMDRDLYQTFTQTWQ